MESEGLEKGCKVSFIVKLGFCNNVGKLDSFINREFITKNWKSGEQATLKSVYRGGHDRSGTSCDRYQRSY